MQRHPLLEAVRELRAMHREPAPATDRILAEVMREVGADAFPPLLDLSAFGRLVEAEAPQEPVRPRPRHRGQLHVTMSRDEHGLHAQVLGDDGARRTVHMRRDGEGGIVGEIEDE